MSEVTKLSAQEKIQARADKLKAELIKANNRLQQIKAKHNSEERKKRTSKLCDTASILYMVNPELIETKSNIDLYRQVLGFAISLNNMRNNPTDENKSKLAQLEHLSKEYLNNKNN